MNFEKMPNLNQAEKVDLNDVEQWREFKKNFDYLGELIDGRAVAEKDGKFFHVDASGQPAYEERFDSAMDFSEGLAGVEKDGRFFHINPDGSPAYRGTYGDVGSFKNGEAWVSQDTKKAKINKGGRIIGEWFDSADV